MDQSVVQQILDHANTRGTAILVRTIREMVKDRKTIFVALISLIPIILGLLWSGYLSDNEDIQEVEINEVSDTADIFCYMDIPRYLPNHGNYTFHGQILNRGDTIQEVSVNITLGNSKNAVSGLRLTTGPMNITPEEEIGGYMQSYDPHEFSITFNMDGFNGGTSYIVIQLHVNNTLSSARLIPDEFDWTQVDFSDFRVQDIIGQNMAVYTDDISIRPVSNYYTNSEDMYIDSASSIMPLSVEYQSMMGVKGDIINCSIESPVNGSGIAFSIVWDSGGSLRSRSHEMSFPVGGDRYNFSILIPNGFAPLGFDQKFAVWYQIIYDGQARYTRFGEFWVDVVKDDYLELADNLTLVMDRDSLYIGEIGLPSRFVSDSLNTLEVNLENHDIVDRTFHLNFTMWVNQISVGYVPRNLTYDITVPASSNVSFGYVIPFIIDEEYILSPSHPRVYLDFHFEVGNETSTSWTSLKLNALRLVAIAGWDSISLEDTFIPSLDARIFIPEDLSKTTGTYEIKGTIRNTGIIEKEFDVVLEIQGGEYRSGKFTVAPGEEGEFVLRVPMKNLTTEFEVEGRIKVYSSRTLLPTDTEAEGSVFVNVIEESHMERKVLENFLVVYVHLYMKFIVPLVAMVYGISLISQESDRRTLALYLTTPMTKIELVLYKFGGYLIAMTLILSIPLILIYFSFSYVLSPDLIVYYLLLLGICIFDLFLAVAAYGAIFTTIGTIEKRPVSIGLSYLMIWEVFMGSLNFFLTQYTIFYHVRCAVFPFVDRYVPNALGSMGLEDISGNEFTVPMEVSMSVIVLVIFVFLFFGVTILSSRDIR